MMLSDKEIRRLCSTGMITNFKNFDVQLQANGFDLTLEKVECITGPGGAIDFNNNSRQLPEVEEIKFNDPEKFDGIERVLLAPGLYLFRSAEIVEMPDDVAAIGVPRSTMSRCGAFVQSAAIDAGYRGKLVFPVATTIPMAFFKHARFIQLLFWRLNDKVAKPYDGIYKEKK